jgi:hypothetical protein
MRAAARNKCRIARQFAFYYVIYVLLHNGTQDGLTRYVKYAILCSLFRWRLARWIFGIHTVQPVGLYDATRRDLDAQQQRDALESSMPMPRDRART